MHIHLRRYELPSLPVKTQPLKPKPVTAPVTAPTSADAPSEVEAPPQYSPSNPLVPIGVDSYSSTADPVALDDALTKEERDAFDVWVRERWTEKDKLLDGFYEKGEFLVEDQKQRREIKLQLRSVDDWVSCCVSRSFCPLATRRETRPRSELAVHSVVSEHLGALVADVRLLLVPHYTATTARHRLQLRCRLRRHPTMLLDSSLECGAARDWEGQARRLMAQ